MQKIDHTLTAEEIRDLVGTSPLMLEIGSHEGSDTVKFLKAMPLIRLYCFEPDPRPIERFQLAMDDDPRMIFEQTCIGHADTPQPFNPSTGRAGGMEDWDHSGSLQKPTGHLKRSPEIGFKEPVVYKCRRLDTWLLLLLGDGLPYDLKQIDFIWADIQGSQRKLIAGGPMALAITRYLYIECHHEPLYDQEPTQEELIDLLPGFEPLAIYDRDNILFRNRHFQ